MCGTRPRWRAGTLSVAESYPTSEVRYSGPECQAAMAQERPGGATPPPSSRVAAKRSYPASEVSGGQEETPRVRGQGGGREELPSVQGQWRLGGDTPLPKSGAPEARGNDPEEPPRAQGQGWQLGGATHAQGEGQRPGGATPRCGGCAGTEGPRGAIPH